MGLFDKKTAVAEEKKAKAPVKKAAPADLPLPAAIRLVALVTEAPADVIVEGGEA